MPLPVSWEHGEAAGALPPHHADPLDRLLIAQARLEGLTILIADAMFARHDVALLWRQQERANSRGDGR